MTFWVLGILLSVISVYIVGEVFFLSLKFISTASVTGQRVNVKLFNLMKIFSVKLSDVTIFAKSNDIKEIRRLGIRARVITRSDNLLVVVYKRSLFGLKFLPKQEFEQAIIARNSLEIFDDLEKHLPEMVYRSRRLN